jgi:hypothetical protein
MLPLSSRSFKAIEDTFLSLAGIPAPVPKKKTSIEKTTSFPAVRIKKSVRACQFEYKQYTTATAEYLNQLFFVLFNRIVPGL